MRVLLDECVPHRLRYELPGHEVRTVQEMGWSSLLNGELLRRAEGRFECFVTVDQNLEYQQSLREFPLPIVVLAAANEIDALRPLMPALRDLLEAGPPRGLSRISSP